MNLVRFEGDLEAVASRAAGIITGGGLIVCPTDTVYGLMCDASNEQAVSRLLDAKGRPTDQALPIAVAGAEDVDRLAEPTAAAAALIRRFWPGALTVVLQAKPVVSPLIAPDGTIGLRAPDFPLLQRMISLAAVPLVATSANLSGALEPTRLEVIAPELLNRVDLVIDAGELPAGKPSTVVDARGRAARVLRAGAVPPDLVLLVAGQSGHIQ